MADRKHWKENKIEKRILQCITTLKRKAVECGARHVKHHCFALYISPAGVTNPVEKHALLLHLTLLNSSLA